MQANIFNSWQSDVEAVACRTLIDRALDAAAHALVEEGIAEVVPAIDRDAEGVPGCPDIGTALFQKIDKADAFVGDVTIIGRVGARKRPVPNPNVLAETFYAIAKLGPDRVVLVQNIAFGSPEDLPFDLRQRRVLTFESHEDSTEREAARRQLTSALIAALAPIIKERAKVHAGDDSKVARWRRLLEAARASKTSVEVDSALDVDAGSTDASGRMVRMPAIVDDIRVAAVDEHTFDLGVSMRGRGGFTIVPTPFSVVHEIWDGKEGRLHVLLNRTILLLSQTSRFV
jgi:hypothetical protein